MHSSYLDIVLAIVTLQHIRQLFVGELGRNIVYFAARDLTIKRRAIGVRHCFHVQLRPFQITQVACSKSRNGRTCQYDGPEHDLHAAIFDESLDQV